MRFLVVAALALGVVAASADGAPPRTCAPAPAPVAAPKTGFEVQLEESVNPMSVTDGQGRRNELIPGIDVEHFVPYGQLEIYPGHVGSYVVAGAGADSVPVNVVLSRMSWQKSSWRPAELASWFLTKPVSGLVTLAFASGEPLAQVRLCVNGTPVPPTTVATHGFAVEDFPPEISHAVTRLANGKSRVSFSTRDRRAPVIGRWTLVRPGPFRMVRYTGPLVVAPKHTVNFWALDRAGNTTSDDVAVR